MAICGEAVQRTLIKSFSYSGKFVMRVGQYNQCINDKQMEYRWTTVSSKIQSSSSVNIGLCLPKQCSNEQITAVANQILESAEIAFRIQSIDSQVNEYEVPYTWVFYFTIILIAILTMLTLTSSIIYKSKLKNNKLAKIFSLQQASKIFHYKQNNLNVFNGIKTYSMLCIILGHEYFFHLGIASNAPTFNETLQTPFFLIVEAGMLAVDVFLFVGGFFVAYAALKSKQFTIGYVPFAVLKRALRFWPSYLFIVLLFYSVFMHLGSGPFWSINESQTELCSHWWRSLLFIDNLVDSGRSICVSWSWYLQIDMQLFLCSLLILTLYRKTKFICIFITIILMAISLVLTFYINFSHHFKQPIHLDDFGPQDTSFTDVYTKPWCRCSPYFYGLLFAMFYIQMHKLTENKLSIDLSNNLGRLYFRLKQSRSLQMLTQLVGAAIILFVIIIPRTSQLGHRWTVLVNAAYLTFSKPLYVFGLSLLILPTLLNFKNSLVKTVLDNKFTNAVSKISFMMYLIHLIIIMQFIYSAKVEVYYSIVPLFTLFIAHATISAVFAIYLVCTIEVPFYKLQQILHSQFSAASQEKKDKIHN